MNGPVGPMLNLKPKLGSTSTVGISWYRTRKWKSLGKTGRFNSPIRLWISHYNSMLCMVDSAKWRIRWSRFGLCAPYRTFWSEAIRQISIFHRVSGRGRGTGGTFHSFWRWYVPDNGARACVATPYVCSPTLSCNELEKKEGSRAAAMSFSCLTKVFSRGQVCVRATMVRGEMSERETWGFGIEP